MGQVELLIPVMLVGVLVLALWWFSGQLPSARGGFPDLAAYLNSLEQAKKEKALLIVTVHGTDDCLHFRRGPAGFLIEFPLVTSHQKALGATVRTALRKSSLVVNQVRGGIRRESVLQAPFTGNATELAQLASGLLRMIYRASESSPLLFEWEGLEPPAERRGF